MKRSFSLCYIAVYDSDSNRFVRHFFNLYFKIQLANVEPRDYLIIRIQGLVYWDASASILVYAYGIPDFASNERYLQMLMNN